MRYPKILALILAGGAGGRLELLTEQRAKPAMPFAGVYRLIDFALSNCVHSRISDVWIVEQYQPHSLNDHLANGRPWDLDRTYGGLQVLPPYLGTAEGGFAQGNADALYRQKRFIRDFDPDLLVVLSADHVYQLDYRAVIDRHLDLGADVTLVTTRVPLEEAGRFGTVRVDGQGRVVDFAYKPETPDSDLVTTEVFVYDAGMLLATLDELAAEATDEPEMSRREGADTEAPDAAALKDFGHKLLPRLVQAGRAYEYRLDAYWRDVGTIASYWQAHQDLLAPEPGLRLDDPGWPILTYGVQSLPARVSETARIDNSLLSPGCTVRGQVIRSVLAPGVIVEPGAVVRDSVLLHDVTVRAGAIVDCAIVDDGSCLGEGTVIGRGAGDLADASSAGSRDREGGARSSSEITLVGRGAHVRSGSRVPPGARVAPAEGAP